MSLTSAMIIGRSALTASQIGIQVAGNNMANAATPGYSRQVATFEPERGDRTIGGVSAGRGVRVRDVRRQVDQALQDRLWAGVSAESSAAEQRRILSAIESTLGELTGYDLSSEMSAFFNSWSERANQTQSNAVVVQKGQQLASFLHRMRTELTDLRIEADRRLDAAVARADQLASEVADLNVAVHDAEVGGATANALRDRRDQAVTELSTILDVTAVPQNDGSINILVGSSPIVLGGSSRGLGVKRETRDGDLRVAVVSRADGQELGVTGGQAGGILQGRTATIDDTLEKLDHLAAQLVFEVNKRHSTGSGRAGLTSATGTLKFPTADRGRALNDPANTTLGDLPFAPINGGFLVHVTQRSTGQTQIFRLEVDLDGLTAAGTPGTGDDTSAEDLRAALDALPGLGASFDAEGKLRVDAGAGYSFSFADDRSSALAVLGVNAYFTGSDASDIGVRADLAADPSLLAAGRWVDGVFVENGTALEIVGVQDKQLTALDGRTLRGHWSDAVQVVGVMTAGADTRAQATQLVRESLEAQRGALSGVSLDEESVNLLNFQRQYQGAARLISVADELTQTLLTLV